MDPATLTVNDLIGPWPLPCRASVYLVGSKSAALVDGILVLSPAMYSLIHSAGDDADELERLARAIPVVVISMAAPAIPVEAATVSVDAHGRLRGL